MTDALEVELREAMSSIHRRAKVEAVYKVTLFLASSLVTKTRYIVEWS